jgi:hypothetical protein
MSTHIKPIPDIDSERVFLTADQAIALLPDSDKVHTFEQPSGFTLIGANWDKQTVIDALKAAPEQGIELTGETATSMGHGLCFQDKSAGEWRTVFCETKDPE